MGGTLDIDTVLFCETFGSAVCVCDLKCISYYGWESRKFEERNFGLCRGGRAGRQTHQRSAQAEGEGGRRRDVAAPEGARGQRVGLHGRTDTALSVSPPPSHLLLTVSFSFLSHSSFPFPALLPLSPHPSRGPCPCPSRPLPLAFYPWFCLCVSFVLSHLPHFCLNFIHLHICHHFLSLCSILPHCLCASVCVFLCVSHALISLSLCICVSLITPICRCSPAGQLMESPGAHDLPEWLIP